MLALAQRVDTFKSTRLSAPPPVVMVDGMWVKIAYPTGAVHIDTQGRRRAVKRKHKRVVLTALGVWPDGHWEILHWQIAAHEDAEAWGVFCKALVAKGVTTETTQLVVSDGAKGLEKARAHHRFGVPHQRCIFHKIKNLTDHLQFLDLDLDPALPLPEATRHAKQARKHAILADAGRIYAAEAEEESRARAAAFRAKWDVREPQAVANFFTDFDKTLSYLAIDFPQAYTSLIRTTNLLERFHKEVRRKERDIGMFQCEQGCEVLWYLIAMRETAKQQATLMHRH